MEMRLYRVYTINSCACAKHLRIQQISVNFDKKIYSVNAKFYFKSSAFDVRPMYNSSHTALHRVAVSYTESSPIKFSQFR